jgi:hypothetical protein
MFPGFACDLGRGACRAGSLGVSERPSAAELLEQGTGLMTRSHLRDLGLPRAGIDAVFKRLDVVFFEGYSRPMVKVEDYLELLAQSTYGRDRVRPS